MDGICSSRQEFGKHKMTSLSEKSGSSRDGTQDSSRDATASSAGGDREATVSSEPRQLSTQRSLTTDTLEMSEDSFAMGDTSG